MTQYGFTLYLNENEMAFLIRLLGQPHKDEIAASSLRLKIGDALQQEQPDHGTED